MLDFISALERTGEVRIRKIIQDIGIWIVFISLFWTILIILSN